MNILKHMEAVFVAALAAVGSAGYAAQALAPAGIEAAPAALTSVATPTRMAVVTVSAKRPDAAEKQRLLAAERAARSRA